MRSYLLIILLTLASCDHANHINRGYVISQSPLEKEDALTSTQTEIDDPSIAKP